VTIVVLILLVLVLIFQALLLLMINTIKFTWAREISHLVTENELLRTQHVQYAEMYADLETRLNDTSKSLNNAHSNLEMILEEK